MISRHTFLLLTLITGLNGCEGGSFRFDQGRAFHYLEKQCDFGPRNPGSAGYYDCRDWLKTELEQTADTVFFQPFTQSDPRNGDVYALSNILAVYGREKPPGILLAAHWDTRPWADEDPDPFYQEEPILGANDGASGVAVLLEMAQHLQAMDLPFQVLVVLLDGEDLGQPGLPQSYAKGSEFLAQNPPLPLPEEGIVLDMVGDKQLTLFIERNSYRQNPELVNDLWGLAREMKLPAFRDRVALTIYDDHIPLFRYGGVRAVDLIDFDYPDQATNYWHTHWDTPEQCSPASLGQVGRLLENFLVRRGRKD
ncbi:MAG: M28 family peptidase [Candidatus Neomarinimicrobiota bacterium]|nr:MAG: M28 family peptidase [Candidatus Neomarinimicrobiota bacterium]